MSEACPNLEELLTQSLEAAAGADADATSAAPGEEVFQILPGLYLGSQLGASKLTVIELCDISLVLNLTSGHAKIPNHFEERCRYLNFEVVDQPGEDILSHAIREGVKEIQSALETKMSAMVHCAAGLSRSATVVVAFLMYQGRSLSEAVDQVTRCRGRRLRINPSFWMVLSLTRPAFTETLAQWERELLMAADRRVPSTPSFDFTDWWLEVFGEMGIPEAKIRKALVIGDWTNFEKAFEAMMVVDRADSGHHERPFFKETEV